MHTKPLTDLFKKEKKFENFISLFDVSPQGLNCVTLQLLHVGAVVVGYPQPHGFCNLAHLLELDMVVHVLRI
jgi:hypothetical protein